MATSSRTAKYDVMVAHAGQQKHAIAGTIYDRFQEHSPDVNVFFDDHSLNRLPSDARADARQRMFDACRTASVGIVVLSKEFVEKQDPMQELCWMVERTADDPYFLLQPILHSLTCEELKGQADQYMKSDTTKEWGEALSKAARFPMIRHDPGTYESARVKEIVDKAVAHVKSTRIFIAIEQDDVVAVDKFVQADCTVLQSTDRTEHEQPPLYVAVVRKANKMVDKLIALHKKFNVDLDMQDKWGKTALYRAAADDYKHGVLELLKAGANKDKEVTCPGIPLTAQRAAKGVELARIIKEWGKPT